MKKIVRVLLAVLMVTCLVCALTACKDDCKKGKHAWDNGVQTTAPSCTEAGVMTYTCNKCQTQRTEPIDPLGHDFENGSVVGTTDATCGSAAIQTVKCARCNVTTERTVGDPLSHNPSATWSVDTVKGTHYKTCQNGCGQRVDEHAIDFVLDDEQPNAPTCTAAGTLTYHCSHDGCTLTKSEEKGALDHLWVKTGETPATCEQAKQVTYKCDREGCNETKTESEGEPLSHSPAAAWSHGEIDGVNKHWHECANGCGTKLGLAECTVNVNVWVHSEIDGVHVHANVCSVCNAGYNQENCASTGGWLNDATNNNHYKQCDKCDFRIEVGAHNADGELVKNADGHAHKCSLCGNTPALSAHTPTEIPAVAPTCNSDGTTAGVKCGECDYVITAPQPDTNRPKHSWVWVYGNDRAEDMTAFAHYAKCSVCGTVDEDSKALNHTLVMTVGDKDYHWEECKCGYADLEHKESHNYDTELVCPVCSRAPEGLKFALRIGDGEYQSWHVNVDGEKDVTLQQVVNLVPANATATIYVGCDISDGVGVFVSGNKNITFRFNNHTYNVARNTVGSDGTENQAFHLEQGSTVAIYNATITADAPTAKFLVQNYSNLTLDNVTLDASANANISYVLSNNCGNVVLKNGTELKAADNKVAMDVYFNLQGNYPEGVSVTVENGCLLGGIIEYGADVEANGWTDLTVLTLPSATRNYNIRFTSETVTCDQANITISGQRLTHTEDNGVVTTEPTCTVDGVTTYTCTRCGHERTEAIAATGHDFEHGTVVGTTNATCTQAKTVTHKCANCDATKVETVGEALGHDFATTLSTDEAKETHYYACSRCDARDKETACTEEIIPAVPATCKDKGLSEGLRCSVCGHVYIEQTETDVDHDNHVGNLVWVTDGEYHYQEYDCCHAEVTDDMHEIEWTRTSTTATCTESGIAAYKCSHEGCTVTKEEAEDALGHDYGKPVYDGNGTTHTATCTRAGCTEQTAGHTLTTAHEYLYEKEDETNHTKMCVHCDYMATEAHTWDDGVVTTEPTCTETGVKTFTCTADGCGATYTEDVAATGHTWSSTYSVDETTGEHYQACVNGCGERHDVHAPDMLTTTSATCTTAGTTTTACQHEHCTVSNSEDVAALGHKVDSAAYVSKGTHSGKCARCDELITEACNTNGEHGECSVCGRKIYSSEKQVSVRLNVQTNKYSASFTQNGVTFKFTGNDIGVTFAPLRWYKSSTLKISVGDGCTITKVMFTDSNESKYKLSESNPSISGSTNGSIEYSSNTFTWTGNTKDITFNASANQIRLKEIIVIYQVRETCYHDNVKQVEEVEADCTHMGFSAACWYCEECGKCYEDANCVTEAEVTVTPALSENGEHSDMDIVIPVKSATCTETGVKVAHKHCSVCGKYFDLEGNELDVNDVIEEINADAHAWGDWTASGTLEAPTHTRTCGNNNAHTDTVECTAAEGAEYQTDPTHHWKECATCGNKVGYAEHDFTNGDCECGASASTQYAAITVSNVVGGTALTENVATVDGLPAQGIVGNAYTFTISVTGYRIASVFANGSELTAADGSYTYTVVDGDNNITINLVQLVKVTVTVNGDSLGSVTPNITLDSDGSAYVDKETEVTLNVVIHDTDKTMVTVTVDGTPVSDITAAITVNADTAIAVTFSQFVNVTLGEVTNGTATVSPNGQVALGTTVTITVTPNSGYETKSVTVNGTEAKAVDGKTGEYTYTISATAEAGSTLDVVVTIDVESEKSYALIFKSNASDATNDLTTANFANQITEGKDYYNSFTGLNKVYSGINGLKFSSSKANGSVTINLAEKGQVKVTKIIISAVKYGSDAAQIAVNGSAAQDLTGTTLVDYIFTFDGNTVLTSIKIDATKRLYVKSITVEYK